MSAIDQAFVKAYARRQLASGASASAKTSSDHDIDRGSSAPLHYQSGTSEPALRIDASHPFARRPLDPAGQSSEAVTTPAATPDLMQHIHTAYAMTSGVAIVDEPHRSTAPPRMPASEPLPARTTAPLQSSAVNSIHREDDSFSRSLASNDRYADHDDNGPTAARVDTASDQLQPPHARTATSPGQHNSPSPIAVQPQVNTASFANTATQTVVSPFFFSDPVATPKPQPLATESRTSNRKREFRAKWEVDAFDVPTTVSDLFFDGALFQQVAHQLADATSTGLKRLLVTSVLGGEGRSTVAVGLAIAAAASGLRVALVDADVTSPSLVDDLRLDVEFGWVEVIRGRLPLEEVCVHSLEDGVTLVPLLAPLGPNIASAAELRQLLTSIEHAFDLVIVDGGSSHCGATLCVLDRFDSAMIVRDSARTSDAELGTYSQHLRAEGVRGVGVIENFVS